MSTTEWALFDGELVPAEQARVSAFDRTLLYGLGAFETLRLFAGRPYLLEEHQQRMQRSLASVGLAVPATLDTLARDLPRLAERAGQLECLARVTVSAGASASDDMHVIVGLRAVPVPRGSARIEVGTVDFAHDERSPLAGVKSTAYLVHYLLRERAEAAGRLDDIMVTPDGKITEATVANVFFVLAGRLVTPSISSAILPGVTRQRVLKLARELDLDPEERVVRREELELAEEAFLTGSGKGLVDVDVLAGRPLPAARPLSRALADALSADIERHCELPAGSLRF